MSAKHLSEERLINNKVIELICENRKFIVSRYDNDRLKYNYYRRFKILVNAEKKYKDLISEQYEKMSHQF